MKPVFNGKFLYFGLIILIVFSFLFFLNKNSQNHLIKAEEIETCFVCMYQDIPECGELITEQKSLDPWSGFVTRSMNKKECLDRVANTGFKECVFEGGKCISRFLNECNKLKKTTYINYRSVVIERSDYLKRTRSASPADLPGLEDISCKSPIIFHSGHGQGLNSSYEKVSGCFSFMAPGGILTFKDSSCSTFDSLDRVREAGEYLRTLPNFPVGGQVVFTANQAVSSTISTSFATLIIKPDNSFITYDKCSKLGYKNYCTNNLCHKVFETATCADDNDPKQLKNKICCPAISYAQRINSTLGIAAIKNEWLDVSKSGQCPNLQEKIKAYCLKEDTNTIYLGSSGSCLSNAKKLCEGSLYNGYFKVNEDDIKKSLSGEDLVSYSCFTRT